ncbi:hypothetical protein BDB00DRAFT_877261 [Zychaea mexicana]|uniref:uncharacterized protein n=1 Tax=Zychaea mexicana TaxID=64656 RepID=UPI0022FEDA8E|nr:uncharacterized protein BDB00DRAFT_877261 [Zychaea mexicana]KAI9488577.1 hypothetical protein BDB00DRAFT_877261 [Zychaea mexicana]
MEKPAPVVLPIIHRVPLLLTMVTCDSTTCSTYTFDVNPAMASFSKVKRAIEEHDYNLAIDFASTTIDQIQTLQLITALDHRAYPLAKKGRFDEAIQDSQKIDHWPLPLQQDIID